MDIEQGTKRSQSKRDRAGSARRVYAPILEPGHTFASITDKISSIVLTRRQRGPAGSSVSRSRSRW